MREELNNRLEDRLLSCTNINEFLALFFGLGYKEKMSLFTDKVTVKEGTVFYRIRKVSTFSNSDCNAIKEWGPPPKEYAKQGRFNSAGERILYVATEEDGILRREVHLNENEEYYLGRYVCKNTFAVGSLLGVNSPVNSLLHKIAMAVPEKNALEEKELVLLDQYLEQTGQQNIMDLLTDMLLPLYAYRYIPNMYDVTNKLGKYVLANCRNGIRYASAYSPIEMSGGPGVIITLAGKEYGNYALTEAGYKNLEFIGAEKRIAPKDLGLELMINVFGEAYIKHRREN